MRRLYRAALILIAFLTLTAPAWAEFYKVNITRVNQDLYKDTLSGILIKTRYCYEYVYSEDAILQWEGKFGDNKLIFKNGNSYDVVDLLKSLTQTLLIHIAKLYPNTPVLLSYSSPKW